MNRKNSRRNLLILIICAYSCVLCACASSEPKDVKAGSDQQIEKIGAEDFMPERTRAVYARSCASCHGHDGRGITAVAPNIYRARHRSTQEWEAYLRDSRDAHPVGHPPPLWLDGDEMNNMAEYLDSVTQRNQ